MAKLPVKCIQCKTRIRSPRRLRCSKCQRERQSKAMKRYWHNKRSIRPVIVTDTGPYTKVTADDLKALMDEADAMSRKAIEAITKLKET